MADSAFRTAQGMYDLCVLVQGQLANCTMHLFIATYNPSPTDPAETFLANECDFDGYSPVTIASWGDPVLQGNAWVTIAPTQTFRWTFDTAGKGNMVGGYVILLASGDVKDYVVFDPAQPMTGTGMAVIRTPNEGFPWA